MRWRRASATDWAAANPVLLQAEAGLVTAEGGSPDAWRFKIGDGVTAWNDLPFHDVVVPGGPAVIDNLASTSAVSALSANQGRLLKGLIDGVTSGGVNTIAGLSGEILNILLSRDPFTPVGTIVWLKLPISSPPAGFLYCGGANKSRNQYPNLFSVIGTTYGAGDGTTTFGLPLEANLVNPFGDSAYLPFIKYGARNGDDGLIAIAKFAGSFNTYNVNGTTFTARSAPDFSPSLNDFGIGSTCSISADANYVAVVGNDGDVLWTAIRNGNSWTRMTVSSPPSSSGQLGGAVAISPDGTTLVALLSNNLFQWTRSGLTWGSRVTLSSNTVSDFSINTGTAGNRIFAEWSRDSVYLALSGTGTRFPIMYKRTGGTLSRLANPPNSSVGNIYSMAWHPSGLFLAVTQASGPAFCYARSGDAFTVLGNTVPTHTNWTESLAWSEDGATLFVPASGGISNGRAGVYPYSFNGSSFTALPSSYGNNTVTIAMYAGSNTELIDFNNNRIMSIASGTLVDLGAGSISNARCVKFAVAV